SLGSPIGYQLRNRYLSIGIPLSEALARDSDPDLRAQLVQLARWNGNSEVRSAGLVTLAKFQDINDLPVFEEAMINLDAGVRFGAIEALQAWGHPDKAKPILEYVAQNDPEYLLRTLAAASLARIGDPIGLAALRAGLDDGSWLIRAMSARYLGDVGTADDYDLIVSRLGRETSYDFVLAEYCIAALKLFPKKQGS
ncbi:MAG: HEAT repeat domain-containing protein, partial [Cyanobacteria bacterium REEB65]|nr:HEAT repeat domain-containing protein [Cyanobacteria bacterium REEB65]